MTKRGSRDLAHETDPGLAFYTEAGVGEMGKLERFAMVAVMGALVGVQTADAPVEDGLIQTTRVLMNITRVEFEHWCAERGTDAIASFDASDRGAVTCAWLDAASDRVWHAAVHFDRDSLHPRKADAGLVDAANRRLLRIVHNEFGAEDAHTGEGFPVWEVEVDGVPARLTVAPFEDITIVRIAREDVPAVLSIR